MVEHTNDVNEENLWEFLMTKNWAISTMKTRKRTICRVVRENLTEDDTYGKYGNRRSTTRTKLRLAIRLSKEFKEWEEK